MVFDNGPRKAYLIASNARRCRIVFSFFLLRSGLQGIDLFIDLEQTLIQPAKAFPSAHVSDLYRAVRSYQKWVPLLFGRTGLSGCQTRSAQRPPSSHSKSRFTPSAWSPSSFSSGDSLTASSIRSTNIFKILLASQRLDPRVFKPPTSGKRYPSTSAITFFMSRCGMSVLPIRG